jgi:thioredoxin reductase (NADPH)
VLSGRDVVGDGVSPSWPLERDPYLLETSIPGVFVAGDVRRGSIKRVASAVGEGATAPSSHATTQGSICGDRNRPRC